MLNRTRTTIKFEEGSKQLNFHIKVTSGLCCAWSKGAWPPAEQAAGRPRKEKSLPPLFRKAVLWWQQGNIRHLPPVSTDYSLVARLRYPRWHLSATVLQWTNCEYPPTSNPLPPAVIRPYPAVDGLRLSVNAGCCQKGGYPPVERRRISANIGFSSHGDT